MLLTSHARQLQREVIDLGPSRPGPSASTACALSVRLFRFSVRCRALPYLCVFVPSRLVPYRPLPSLPVLRPFRFCVPFPRCISFSLRAPSRAIPSHMLSSRAIPSHALLPHPVACRYHAIPCRVVLSRSMSSRVDSPPRCHDIPSRPVLSHPVYVSLFP